MAAMQHVNTSASNRAGEPPTAQIAASALTFFVLTFVVTWAFWIVGAAFDRPSLSPAVRQLIFLPGVFSPALVALALTARAGGLRAVDGFLKNSFAMPARLRWWVFAVGYLAAVKLVVAVVFRIIIGQWPMFGSEQLLVMLFAVVLSTPFQSGEEIGWRAYALPRMSAHMGLGWASLVLGVVWACWHLPLFLIPGTPNAGESFPVYLLSVTPLSIAIAYLYWRTGAALLPVMVMHAAINNTKDIVPSALSAGAAPFFLGASRIGWLTAAVLWMAAVYFLVRMRGVNTVGRSIRARSIY